MGTRGVIGYHKNGIDKIMYNHFDSYPSYLGKNMARFIEETSVKQMNANFDEIIMVEEYDQPTEEQIKECAEYTNLSVSEQSVNDWYCLLRKAQGSLQPYRDGLKYMIEYSGFLKDSLFCEWGYVINLDTNKLEVYKGGQREPQKNRYYTGIPGSSGYYNCKLIAQIPLEKVDEELMDQLEKKYA